MSVLIIGGDNIGPIELVLNDLGVNSIEHWNARNENKTNRKIIPANVDCLIMLVNFLNHNTMHKFKNEAKKRKIPFVCANRNKNSISYEFCKKFNLSESA